jgi:NADPH:quinone reductase-like Zn-dependent oxidoreductase
MKAAVCQGYGPPEVVVIQERETPLPKPDEVRIKARVTTVTSGDFRVRSLEVPAGFGLLSRLALGVLKPRQPVLGSEVAGVVDAVGKDVTSFKVGDPVIAFSDVRMGCHAEYLCIKADGVLAHKPEQLSWEEAAALSFGGTTGLVFLRKAKIASGERVLVNGASGAVGTACVQLARHFGAEVTGVCSAANAELLRSLGAARVIDYTREDFSQNGQTYDVIVDTVGTAPYARSRGSLAAGGRLLLIFATLGEALRSPWVSLTSKAKVIGGVALGRAEDLRFLADLARAGEFKPVVDRSYPFEQIVEAHRYVAAGHKRGSVVVTFGEGAATAR